MKQAVPVNRCGAGIPPAPGPQPVMRVKAGFQGLTPLAPYCRRLCGLAGAAVCALCALGAPVVSARAADNVFATRIQPLFAERCGACHGEAKQRGGLALHTSAAISEGGDSGPVFVAGKPAESEIIRRLRLPVDDDDHMPPKSKPQLSEEEIKAVEAWILAGAPLTPAASAPAEAPAVKQAPPAVPAAAPAGTPDEPPAPDANAVNALRDHLVHVEALAAGSHRLRISFAAAARTITPAQVTKLLEPLLPQLETLSLARCSVGDETAELLARAPRLTRLDLRGTRITDAGLGSLSRAKSLKELVLAQTHLTDAGAVLLAAMPALERVYLWKSGLSPEAVAQLQARRPALRIDIGDSRYAATQTAEAEIKLTGDAPLPGQVPPAPAATQPAATAAPSPAPSQPAAALKPINAKCPVSGGPVDPRYTVVHGDRVIGFCCPKCPTQFWTDPAQFESKLTAGQ